jgi:hypothetical protein
MELLPELKVLSFPGGSNVEETFASFIDARQNAGHPISVVKQKRVPWR